ncbi:MAG: segregation/condensation protein A [Vagococcus sp.]
MNELNIKLDVFEGPLDLLLHLIKTLEIDIYDIPISQITEQYMAYIHSMKVLDLEIAGDYIVMAATLMSIKSKMLLPKIEMDTSLDSEYISEEDPREQLVTQLLEYRKFKYAATLLKEKETERGMYYTKEATNLDDYRQEIVPLEPNEVTTIDLYLAFSDILNRQRDNEPLETTVVSEEFTIEDKVLLIHSKMMHLNKTESIVFDSLFQVFTRNEIVTTFMAILELIKSGSIIAKQSHKEQPIQLFRKN